MMFRKKYTNRAKLNFILFIIGLSLGGVIGFILIQGNSSPLTPPQELSTENKIPESIALESEINDVEISTSETEDPSTSETVIIPKSPDNSSLGNKDAAIVMYEFSDFQCPYCREYSETTFKKIKTNYIDTGIILYHFKHLPLTIHPQAYDAAIAAYCAQEQDKFWEMHDKLFAQQSDWSYSAEPDQLFATYAEETELDVPSFENCTISENARNNIEADLSFAKQQEIELTPSFYINNIKIVGAQDYQNFADTIDGELTKE